MDMMDNAHVLVAPGSDFCPNAGKHFVRLSYAGSTESIEKSIDRIAAWRG